MAVVLLVAVGASLPDVRARLRPLLRRVRTVGVLVIGGLLLLAGVAMMVLPGPGLLVLAAGLGLLGTEFAWARRPLRYVRRRLDGVRRKLTRQPAESRPPVGAELGGQS